MDDVELQDITDKLHAPNTSLESLQTSLKALSPVEKMSNDNELKVLQ